MHSNCKINFKTNPLMMLAKPSLVAITSLLPSQDSTQISIDTYLYVYNVVCINNTLVGTYRSSL